MSKEKKTINPVSIKLLPSTKKAVDKAVHDEDRSLSYIAERALRKDLKDRGYLNSEE